MKLINKIKNNILGFIIGGIIFGSLSVTIASQILSTQVSYTNEKSISNVTSVDGALTELYGLAEECQNASSSGSTVEYKGKDAVAVYLDPTGTQTNCSSSNFSSTASTGCFRFYVYAEDSEYKYAILDHNTTATVSGFYAAQSKVKEDTSSWNPNLQARNISAMEIYKITENTNNKTNWNLKNNDIVYFNATNSAGTIGNGQGYGWLFDRTRNCTGFGCTTNDNGIYSDNYNFGYWTSDIQNKSYAWYSAYEGCLAFDSLSFSSPGVRPVIQIAK